VRRTFRTFEPQRVAFDASGRYLLVSGAGWGSLRRIDLDAEGRPATAVLHEGSITATCFDPTGTTWLSAGRDGAVFVWDVATCRAFSGRRPRHGPLLCAAFGPASGAARVIAGCEDGSVLVFPVDPLPAGRARAPRALADWERANAERLEGR
jgi:WD40 repeat protein